MAGVLLDAPQESQMRSLWYELVESDEKAQAQFESLGLRAIRSWTGELLSKSNFVIEGSESHLHR